LPATEQALPSSGPPPCGRCGAKMIDGWIGAQVPDAWTASAANLIWIDKDDEGKLTEITVRHFLKPLKVPALRCDHCGIVEMQFPPGFLAKTMAQGFPAEQR